MKINQSKDDRMLEIVVSVSLAILCITTLYPFWNLIVVSLLPSTAPMSKLYFFPPAIDFQNYLIVLRSPDIYIGFRNSVVRLVLGTILSVIVTITMAYPLSKKYLPNRTFWTAIIVFTMYFGGGLIPTYLLITNTLELTNTIWAWVLPNLVSAFHLIIARNFLSSIPKELEESARIDGAGDFRTFVQIIVPLSKPIIATVALWTAVGLWNEWFDALLYTPAPEMAVLQMVMRRVIMAGSNSFEDALTMDELSYINPENLKASTVIVATVPILITYPFVQKYFVRGVLVGSLKG